MRLRFTATIAALILASLVSSEARAEDYGFTIRAPESAGILPGDALASFPALVRLRVTEGAPPVAAWSIAIATSGPCTITNATTNGTVAAAVDDAPPGVRDGGFEATGLTIGAGNEGAASVVVLSFQNPVVLPDGGSPYDVLRLLVDATDAGPCGLEFRDGLIRNGRAVDNTVTAAGQQANVARSGADVRAELLEPEIATFPPAVDFGRTRVGRTRTRDVVVVNRGDAPLQVTRVALAPGSDPAFGVQPVPTPVTLPPRRSAALRVVFSAALDGDASGALVIESDDPTSPRIEIDLTASAGSGVLDVARAKIDYGDVPIGDARVEPVVLLNTGTAVLEVSSIELTPDSDAAFGIESDLESLAIAPGGRFAVGARFAPGSTSLAEGRVRIESGGGTIEVALSGRGTSVPRGRLELSAGAIDFGEVRLGSSSTAQLTLSNTGDAALRISRIAPDPGTSPEFGYGGPATIDMPPASSIELELSYEPADVGPDTGALRIASDDPERPLVVVELAGRARADLARHIDVEPAELDFRILAIGGSRSRSVVVENVGDLPVDISDIAFGPGTSGAFGLTVASTALTLAPEASLEIQVRYAPTAAGQDTGTLRILSNDDDEPELIVPVSGTAAAVLRELTITPERVDFGDVTIGSTAVIPVTIESTGNRAVTIDVIELSPADATEFTVPVPPLPRALPPGAMVSGDVEFSPTSAGAVLATIRIESDDSNNPTITVPLGGTGVDGPVRRLELGARMLDFERVRVGESARLSLVLASTGNEAVEILALAIADGSSEDFTLDAPPAPFRIAPRQERQIDVIFAPSAPGPITGALRITSDANTAPNRNVGLIGIGTQARLEVDPETLDFGVVARGDTTELDVTLSSTGNDTLEISNIALGAGTSADFAIVKGPVIAIIEPDDELDVTVRYTPTDGGPDAGTLIIESDGGDAEIALAGESPSGRDFIRADANIDSRVDISDGVLILNVLFLGIGSIDCEASADANANGGVNLSDAVYIFNRLFTGGPPFAPPNACGEGSAEEGTCERYPFCE